jgi:paraquat-inducible protein A
MSGASICICPDCDLVFDLPLLSRGQVAECSRCGAVLCRNIENMTDKTVAYTLAGLLFYIPANILPVLTLQILNLDSTNSMLNGVQQLFTGGYWWMAFLVLMCSVVVPLLDLGLLFFISLGLKIPSLLPASYLKKMMHWQHQIQEWGMTEVYMLGILVAYIKMIDMGEIIIGTGLMCFVGMLASVMLAKSTYNVEVAFDTLEAQENP